MKKKFKKAALKAWFTKELDGILGEGELMEILLRLLEHHDISRLDWAIAQEVEIDIEIWSSYITELKRDKPIQYILGYEYFAGDKYTVSSDVLIPRPETEELVNWIAEENKNKKSIKILEIGTGSGCIAISLKKKLPQATIKATDICEGALQIAQQNAYSLHAEVSFVLDNALDSKISETDFDVIVSNPPYIPKEEAAGISSRVKKYEPNLALFTEEKKPLQFYEAIIELAKDCLEPTGSIYFEVHEDYAEEVLQLSEKNGMSSILRNDFYVKPRMIKIF